MSGARRRRQAPIVVVGAGVAGLATALAAAPAPVLLLCRRADGGGSASAMAQGGIAAALDPHDDPQAHAADTIAAGGGHNHATTVQWLCRQAPATLAWLSALGVPFDRGPDGRLSLGREGGHRCARIAHAGGDATGAAMVRVLQAQARAAAHVEWRGGLDAEALLLRGGAACGVRARDADGVAHEIEASAVVLATGGLGALFARTSNPAGSDGAGLALARAAGAALRDLEFVQFHPTALAVAGHGLPLLTEALRGAGATLRDHRGRPLMAGLHPLADLAPRDLVARRVWRASCEGGAWLDARAVAGDWATRFPTALAACRAIGLDPRGEPLPVTPVAHFHMGGIAADADGATSVPGLHAVGEVACNGVHGGNRLASNSLLEGIACGRRLGARLSLLPPPVARGACAWRAPGAGVPAAAMDRVRELSWTAAGPERDAATLRRAIGELRALQGCGWQAGLAAALCIAALARPQSLGAHHRRDAASAMRHRMAGAA